MSRELLAQAWQAGAGPGDGPLTIDLDSTICETYGLAKEGARHHGYTGQRGYHPLLAVAVLVAVPGAAQHPVADDGAVAGVLPAQQHLALAGGGAQPGGQGRGRRVLRFRRSLRGLHVDVAGVLADSVGVDGLDPVHVAGVGAHRRIGVGGLSRDGVLFYRREVRCALAVAVGVAVPGAAQ